jgi:uncharacterized DUF497 family protein
MEILGPVKTDKKKYFAFYVYERYNEYTMEFEFDPDKSDKNKEKHGIDFVEAQALWDDSDLIEIPARTTDESRFMVIGKIAGQWFSGVITYRGKAIRIISVRQSRKEEIDIYES